MVALAQRDWKLPKAALNTICRLCRERQTDMEKKSNNNKEKRNEKTKQSQNKRKNKEERERHTHMHTHTHTQTPAHTHPPTPTHPPSHTPTHTQCMRVVDLHHSGGPRHQHPGQMNTHHGILMHRFSGYKFKVTSGDRAGEEGRETEGYLCMC